MLPLFTYTTCGLQSGSSSWEEMYKLFEDEKPHRVQHKVTVNDSDSSEATIEEVANSFMHQVVAHPKIIPYADMVRWILKNLNIWDINFLTNKGTTIGSFKEEDLK